jgi:quercetin dioxygenase-like cupin family protein
MEIIYEPKHTEGIRALDTMYPTYAMYFDKDAKEQGIAHATTFGYVLTGSAKVTANGQGWWVQEGNYFAFHGAYDISNSSDFKLWTVTKLGYRCMPVMGQTESNGRLSYIDGCSDSVLVSMPRQGDPVLNYLHFPTGIYQTQHTHPSVRMGVVISGEGEAFQEKSNYSDGWVKPLKKGRIFMLTEQELHSFRTSDSHMDIVAFHPDSDTGPTDENHSMINRTYIDHGK